MSIPKHTLPEPLKAVVTKSEPRRRFSRFNPVTAIVSVLIAYFGSQLLAGIVLGGIGSSLGKSGEELVNLLTDSITWQFAFIALIELFTIALIWLFMKRLKVTLKTIGLGRKPVNSDISYGLFTFVIYFIVLIAITTVIKYYVPSIDIDQEQQIGFESATGRYQLILVFVSLAILPPLVEEIVVRGFLFSGLRTRIGKLKAALIASFIFAIAHLQLGSGAPPLWIAAIDTFVLSMVLIQLRIKTGSLWAGMLVHGLKNSLAFVALFLIK
jgi:membrane protease YdiL (CAAX protease family)